MFNPKTMKMERTVIKQKLYFSVCYSIKRFNKTICDDVHQCTVRDSPLVVYEPYWIYILSYISILTKTDSYEFINYENKDKHMYIN